MNTTTSAPAWVLDYSDKDRRRSNEHERAAAEYALVKALSEAIPCQTAVVWEHLGPMLVIDGITVKVTLGQYQQEDRIIFSIFWPVSSEPGRQQQVPHQSHRRAHGDPATEITLANTAPLPRMIKELQRRLITAGSIGLWRAMAECLVQQRKYADLTKASIKAICDAADAKIPHTDQHAIFPRGLIYRLMVSGDQVSHFELRSVPVPLALKLIELIRKEEE